MFYCLLHSISDVTAHFSISCFICAEFSDQVVNTLDILCTYHNCIHPFIIAVLNVQVQQFATEFPRPDYNFNVAGDNSIVFQLSGCQDASVFLSEYPATRRVKTYELVIGAENNQYVGIRRVPNLKFDMKVEIDKILFCNGRPQTFWVR